MSRAIVVVPCYNEAKRLDLRAIQEFGRGDGPQLLFVNDGSRDETLEMLTRLQETNPRRFSFLHLPQNGGKAEAVRQGTLQALASEPDYVGFWDADLATPLADIARFCQVLDDHQQIELVVGTRMPLLGHRIERQPLRYYLGRIFARVASLVLGLRIFDTQCGAKLFRVTPETERLFNPRFLTRWIFDVELMARMRHERRGTARPPIDQTIYEHPLDQWRDVAGSAVKSGDFVKAVAEMANIYWTYLRPGAAGLPTSLPVTSPTRHQPDRPQPDRQQAA